MPDIRSQSIPTDSYLGRDAPKPGYSGAGAPGSLNTRLSPEERDRLRMEEWEAERKAKQGKDASHPGTVSFRGRTYYATGKTGTHRSTGESSAEYADENDRRVWRRASGKVEEE